MESVYLVTRHRCFHGKDIVHVLKVFCNKDDAEAYKSEIEYVSDEYAYSSWHGKSQKMTALKEKFKQLTCDRTPKEDSFGIEEKYPHFYVVEVKVN